MRRRSNRKPMFKVLQVGISSLRKVVSCKPVQQGSPLFTSPSEIRVLWRQNLTRSLSDQPDNDKKHSQPATSEDEDDDWSNDDTSSEFHINSKEGGGGNDQNVNHADASKEGGGGNDQDANHADASDDDYMKPQPRKERIRKCLAKLKKGPDGRFINVLEVTSDINMLIAAYQSLKAKSRPTYLIEDSDDDDSMEGINIPRLKKLQKRLRNGTYRVGTQKEPKKK